MASEALKQLLAGRPIHVLHGGFSNERLVSLASGESVASALEGAGHSVVRVDVDKNFAAEGHALLAGTGLAFIVLHGEFGEDGELQEILEGWNLPYTGSGPRSSRLAMDKVLAKRVFVRKGLRTPRWEAAPRAADPGALVQRYGLPMVIKPSASGSSIGVTIVQKAEQIPAALAEAGRHRGVPLVEEFIPGRELTVGILGAAALPVIELRPRKQFYDYDAKYNDDAGTEYLCPAPVDESVAAAAQAQASAAHRALGCRHFSRVDLRLSPELQVYVLEVNTIPGFTSHSLLPKAAAAAGVDFTALVERIAEMALTERRKAAIKAGGTSRGS
jgi:D-alanine--D-alanine ligase